MYENCRIDSTGNCDWLDFMIFSNTHPNVTQAIKASPTGISEMKLETRGGPAVTSGTSLFTLLQSAFTWKRIVGNKPHAQGPVMIAQWDSSLSVLPVARVQFPATAEYFKGFFPGWSHSANPSCVAENGSMTPHNLWTARRKAEIQPRTDDGW